MGAVPWQRVCCCDYCGAAGYGWNDDVNEKYDGWEFSPRYVLDWDDLWNLRRHICPACVAAMPKAAADFKS
jgi:hypothetical protein